MQQSDSPPHVSLTCSNLNQAQDKLGAQSGACTNAQTLMTADKLQHDKAHAHSLLGIAINGGGFSG